ncbi:hypothetical protein FRB90_006479 [Tulasnella sp. 427]|nr:hypothetical protein FRB90_006479 [Tulasnella sp. 427]
MDQKNKIQFLKNLPTFESSGGACTPEAFVKFATSPVQDALRNFPPTDQSCHSIKTDDDVPKWTYFQSYCSAIGANVPVSTGFYDDLAYLLNVSKPIVPVLGLEELTERNLDAAFSSGNTAIVARIRMALGGGRPVIVRNCHSQFEGVSMDANDPTFTSLTVNRKLKIDAQDLTSWPDRVDASLEDFFKHRANPLVTLNLLDMTSLSFTGRPLWMRELFCDPGARRLAISLTNATIPDLIRLPAWVIAGHPFSHSFVHHDTTGVATFAKTDKGKNIWVVQCWTKDEIGNVNLVWHKDCLERGDIISSEYSCPVPWSILDGEVYRFDVTIYVANHVRFEPFRVAEWRLALLEEGDMMYVLKSPGSARAALTIQLRLMPPAMPHFVYKPCTTLTTGGHGFIWEALPFSELGCRRDNLTSVLSNDVHPSVELIYAAMALLLPDNPENAMGTSGRQVKEIESLARLVLAPALYRQATHPGGASDKRYRCIPSEPLLRLAKAKMARYSQHLQIAIPPKPQIKDAPGPLAGAV